MHDLTNTRGGTCGFLVEFVDGGTMREDEGTWDDVPTGRPVKAVSLVHLKRGIVWVRLAGYEQYVFSNLASAQRSNAAVSQGEHAGKVLGGCKGLVAQVVSLSFPSGEVPKGKTQTYAVADLPFAAEAFRAGA